jgi:hypothetical protein
VGFPVESELPEASLALAFVAVIKDLVSVSVLLVDGVDVNKAYAVAQAALSAGENPPLVFSAMVSGLAVPRRPCRGFRASGSNPVVNG